MTRAGWLVPVGPLPLPLLGILAGLVIAAVGARSLTEPVVQGRPAAPDTDAVEAVVRSHLYEWAPLTDPLITLEDGVQVKSSNLKGIEIGGHRYFYRPLHSFSADPVRNGRPGDYQLVLLVDPGTPFETEVYRVVK